MNQELNIDTTIYFTGFMGVPCVSEETGDAY